uniref:Uncharacterized protein n=1 Tax=Amphimedon queenslandica TaxID=400682 RepID=A0A1X7V064_AMPQE
MTNWDLVLPSSHSNFNREISMKNHTTGSGEDHISKRVSLWQTKLSTHLELFTYN